MSGATVYLLVGLPCAGKTTLARELEAGRPALRLTPDEWMLPLFAESDPDGKRDVLEGRLIEVGLRVAALGTDVVIDFGLWGRDERSALRWLARAVGASATVRYLPVDVATQQRRIDDRYQRAPHNTFPVTEQDLARFRAGFEVPDRNELDGLSQPEPPAGYRSWSRWAAQRWPSLPDAYG